MADMKGKVALVVGGSYGIGRETAHAFAQAGAKVVVAARGVEQGEQTVSDIVRDGGEAIFVQADVSRAGEVEKLVAKAVAAYGRMDYAFNNAASARGAGALTADFEEEEFDHVMATNLKGLWLCMKYEIRQMLQQQPAGGAIVNTSSINGLGGARGGALYSASKAGVLALTKSAAQEYATHGIRVNALVPGAVRTPMLEGIMWRAAGHDTEALAQVEARYQELAPMKRIGRPEEAATAVLWLCSDAASYVTGHSLIVDGGATAYAR
jgi:NAD(P)-dependent dehydrogenase (short-subunit alcohol dehydrogenase family)